MDITGLSKARILRALYNHTNLIAPMAIFTGQSRSENMSVEEAQRIIDDRGSNLYFDYLHGRMIKTDIAPNVLDLRLYDRDNGQGAGETVILDEFTRPE